MTAPGPTSVGVRAPYVDDHGVTRYGSIQALPYDPLVCLARGHNWNDPPNVDGRSEYRCDRGGCGREKTEDEDITGEIVFRDYRGGHMLAVEVRVPRREARAELRRRKRAAADQAQAAADAAADLEMRAAVEGHRVQFQPPTAARNGSAR